MQPAYNDSSKASFGLKVADQMYRKKTETGNTTILNYGNVGSLGEDKSVPIGDHNLFNTSVLQGLTGQGEYNKD